MPDHVRIQKILITRFERKRSKALQVLTIWAVLGIELSLSAKFTCQVRSIITEMPVHMDCIFSWSRTNLRELISVFTHFHLRQCCRSSVPDLAFQDAIVASQTAKQAIIYSCMPRVMRYSSSQAHCKGQKESFPDTLNSLNFAGANCHLPSLISPLEWQVHLATSVFHSLGEENACCVGTGRRHRQPRTNLLTWHSIQLSHTTAFLGNSLLAFNCERCGKGQGDLDGGYGKQSMIWNAVLQPREQLGKDSRGCLGKWGRMEPAPCHSLSPSTSKTGSPQKSISYTLSQPL